MHRSEIFCNYLPMKTLLMFSHPIVSAHIVVDNDGILIRNVQESDEGVYTCRVRVQDLGTVEERHIKLEVLF